MPRNFQVCKWISTALVERKNRKPALQCLASANGRNGFAPCDWLEISPYCERRVLNWECSASHSCTCDPFYGSIWFIWVWAAKLSVNRANSRRCFQLQCRKILRQLCKHLFCWEPDVWEIKYHGKLFALFTYYGNRRWSGDLRFHEKAAQTWQHLTPCGQASERQSLWADTGLENPLTSRRWSAFPRLEANLT